jgi:hypothetical protein
LEQMLTRQDASSTMMLYVQSSQELHTSNVF